MDDSAIIILIILGAILAASVLFVVIKRLHTNKEVVDRLYSKAEAKLPEKSVSFSSDFGLEEKPYVVKRGKLTISDLEGDKKKEKPEETHSVNALFSWNSETPVWVCDRCETENKTDAEICRVCGKRKSDR